MKCSHNCPIIYLWSLSIHLILLNQTPYCPQQLALLQIDNFKYYILFLVF